MRFLSLAAALCFPALAMPAAAADRPMPGYVRVRIVTTDGPIVLALDQRHAPKTTANFLAYCDQTRFDGTAFYRAARRGDRPDQGFIEAGIGGDLRRSLKPIPLEPTSKTGIHHVDGTISMARYELPGSATGNFSILVGAIPTLDAHPGDLGYAAFGHVVSGMDTVKRILAEPTVGGDTIAKPVRILSARRIDGVAAPAPKFKPWLLHFGR